MLSVRDVNVGAGAASVRVGSNLAGQVAAGFDGNVSVRPEAHDHGGRALRQEDQRQCETYQQRVPLHGNRTHWPNARLYRPGVRIAPPEANAVANEAVAVLLPHVPMPPAPASVSSESDQRLRRWRSIMSLMVCHRRITESRKGSRINRKPFRY